MPSFPSRPIPVPKSAHSAILAACAVFGLAACLQEPVQPARDKDTLELSYGAAVDFEGCGVSAFKTEIVSSLTTVSGDLDWVYYGYQGVNDVIRKAGGNSQIKKDNIGTVVHYPPPIAPYVRTFTWSGGTPIASAQTNNGIRADRINEGFNVRMPAGTVSRMATVYVSTVNAQGRLTVDIPGGNVEPAVVLADSKGSSNGYRSFVFRVYFRAKSNAEVSIKWVKTEDYNAGKGTVVLHGAGFNTFNDTPPLLGITNVATPGYEDMAISGKAHILSYYISTQVEGVRKMQLFRDGELVATVNGFGDFPPMTMLYPRKAQYDVLVTDNLGNRQWSNSRPYYLWTLMSNWGHDPIPDNSTDGPTARWAYDHPYIGDLRVWLNMDHPYVGDLKVTITSPSGGEWAIINRDGGPGDNVIGLQASESFSNYLSGSSPPYTGKFKPSSVISPILTNPSNGVWTLKYQDLAAQDVGTTGQTVVFMRDP